MILLRYLRNRLVDINEMVVEQLTNIITLYHLNIHINFCFDSIKNALLLMEYSLIFNLSIIY